MSDSALQQSGHISMEEMAVYQKNMPEEDSLLKQEFLVGMNLEQYENKKSQLRVLISFIALPRSGKSTIAHELSKRLQIPTFSNDLIRRFFNAHGISGEMPKQALLTDISDTSRELFLTKGVSHILDADIIGAYERIQGEAEGHGFHFLLIKIECPEDVILLRIRNSKGVNNSQADEERYFKRIAVHKEISLSQGKIFFTVNSDKEITSQIELLVDRIHKL